MIDQILNGKLPTIERLALLHVLKEFPGLKRKGFSGAVRKACDGEIRASLTSCAMRNLKSEGFEGLPSHRSDEDLLAMITSGGEYHDRVVKGGDWWNDWQEDVAKFKKRRAA